jgi:hypothetical protein
MFSISTLFISLAAGRIWWIRRHVVTILEPSVTRTYDTVIAMVYDDLLSAHDQLTIGALNLDWNPVPSTASPSSCTSSLGRV